MKTIKQLKDEIKMLELKRDMHLLESETAYFLFNKNKAKADYNTCLLDLKDKRAEFRNL